MLNLYRIATIALAWLAVSAPSAFAQTLDAPVQGFVSIEAYEVRQTFVVRIDAVLPDRSDDIQVTDHDAVLKQVLDTLSGKCPLTLDGAPVELEHERSEFIRNDPVLAIVTDEREAIPANEAAVAVVFAASRTGFPDSAAITWDFFPRQAEEIEVTFRSPSDKKLFTVTPDAPSVTWPLSKKETLPQPEKLPGLTPLPRLSIPLLSIILGLFAAAFAILSKRLGERTPAVFGLIVLGSVIAAAACWNTGRYQIVHPFKKPAPVTAGQADEITYALLINLYHAFDYRDEEAIYDTLANSASGDLLERIYFEIRKSLTLEDQGGAKVRIKNVDLRRCIPTPLADADTDDPRAFSADCEWVAIGDVTHWAHTHTRLNRYSAELSITPVEGEWKITGLQILEEFSEVQKEDETARAK